MKKAAMRKQIKALRRKLRKPKAKPATAAVSSPLPLRVVGGRKRGISPVALANALRKRRRSLDAVPSTPVQAVVPPDVFKPYIPPPGVLPPNQKPKALMAMDSANSQQLIAWAQSSIGAYWTEGLTFMGYAELSNLTVRPEYRVISQVIATECTRKWITFQSIAEQENEGEFAEGKNEGLESLNGQEDAQENQEDAQEGQEDAQEIDEDGNSVAKDAFPEEVFAELQQAQHDKQQEKEAVEAERRDERLEKMTGKDDKADRIKELNDELDRLNVRDLFYKIVELDGWMGRAHLFVDLSGSGPKPKEVDPKELMTDIGDGRSETTKLKVKKGDLRRFAVVEPIWTYPQDYNSIDPLAEDWYNPSSWFVMGKQLHASRLLTFVGRPVPDILKPAYAFGGLSLSQICKPYIDNWLQTRQSVNDIINAFSVMVLQTDMTAALQQGGDSAEGDLFNRLDMFNLLRDNRGVFAVDKETEEFKNVAAPISGLDKLQAQAQEHMAAVSRIPLVKLLGISPSGLNASSEGELKTFYDTINAYQEAFMRPNLTRVVHLVMMNLWGEVDEDITFKFEQLWALDEKEEAEVRKIEAETDDILVNGVAALHPEEVRRRIATDPNTPYEDIDVGDMPEAPVDEGALNLKGNEPFAKGAQGEEDEGGGGGGSPFGGGGPEGGNPFGGSDDEMPEILQGGRSSSPGRRRPVQSAIHQSYQHRHQAEPGSSQGSRPIGTGKTSMISGGGLVPTGQLQAGADRVSSLSSPGLSPEAGPNVTKLLAAAIAMDAAAAWNESDHPRVQGGEHGGEFTAGGGGGSSGGEKEQASEPPKASHVTAFLDLLKGAVAGGSSTDIDKPKDNPDGSVTITTRYFGGYGGWKNPSDAQHEEDYDWQKPTEQTWSKVGELKDAVEKMGYKLDVAVQEKNYMDFTIKPAGKKAAPAEPTKTESTAPAAGQYAGMYETKGKSAAENHGLTANKVLNKPAQKGIHYRRLVAHLIKEASNFGNEAAIPDLKVKLREALIMTHDTLIKKGDYTGAEKIAQVVNKMGMEKLPEPKGAPPVISGTEKLVGKPVTPKSAPTPAPTPTLSTLPKPTAAELEAAKKTSAYYPVPSSIEGTALANKFNEKYQNVTITDPDKLAEKVQAYKQTKAAIEAAETKFKAESAAKQKAEAAKIAEQKAKAQAEAAKKIAAENSALMQELGINEQEAYGFGALAKMMGGNQADLVSTFKSYEQEAKALGYPISGFQCALIRNYSGSGYASINEALRSGSWTEAQHVYVKMVNKALQGMPKYKGTVRRGTSLSIADQSKYKVGHIVEERAFTSTSTGKGWDGNTNYVINSIGERGSSIKKLSNHPGENEVLFSARTFFKVTHVEGTAGGKMTVHMEEMPHHD